MQYKQGDNYLLSLKIIEKNGFFYKIKIFNDKEECFIAFSPVLKNLVFLTNNRLGIFLKKNEYQLRKLLHNKKNKTFFVGFELKFVIKDSKSVKSFNNPENLIILDRRNGQYITYTSDTGKEKIYKIYTDGSYFSDYGCGGFAAIIKNPDNKLDMVWGTINQNLSSTLIELLAAIKGLEKINHIKEVRIITDSRYVIKGLTEWVINWKLNNWHTVQGDKVKNIDFWKKFDELTNYKYIEFQWIKGHSNHFENTLCDMYARKAAEKSKKIKKINSLEIDD